MVNMESTSETTEPPLNAWLLAYSFSFSAMLIMWCISSRQGVRPEPPLSYQKRLFIGERITNTTNYNIPGHILDKIRAVLEHQAERRNPDIVRKLDQEYQKFLLAVLTYSNRPEGPPKAHSTMDPFRDLMFSCNFDSFSNVVMQPYHTWVKNDYGAVFEDGGHQKLQREVDVIIWTEVSHMLSPCPWQCNDITDISRASTMTNLQPLLVYPQKDQSGRHIFLWAHV